MAIKSKATKIEGFDELIKALAVFGDEAMPILQKHSGVAADVVLQRAKALVPFETGALRDSLHVKSKDPKRGVYRVNSWITWGDDVRAYAAPLELGHKVKFGKDAPVIGYAKPRPYLRPAADKSKKEVVAVMMDGVNEALEKMGGLKAK